MSQSPFDINPELAAMREDVAGRVFKLRIVETIINIATFALVAGGVVIARKWRNKDMASLRRACQG